MASIKYSVWFHGSEAEHESICWEHRKPFITDSKEKADEFLKFMKDNNFKGDAYSVCMIIVNDVE